MRATDFLVSGFAVLKRFFEAKELLKIQRIHVYNIKVVVKR